MLQPLLAKLCKQLDIPLPSISEKKTFTLPFQKDLFVSFEEQNENIFLKGNLFPCPQENREELFLYLMKANLFGQGTGNFTIGLDPDENFLTLSTSLPYEIKEQEFKEVTEDFVNFLLYWKGELETWTQKKALLG